MKAKTIVITGGSSGLGLAILKRFLKENWKVCILSRTPPPPQFEFNSNPFFKFIKCDIRDSNQVVKAFGQLDGIDIFVNNASIFKSKSFIEMDFVEINEILDTNLKGTIYCTLSAIKKMKEGRIINISSVSGLHGIENQTIYSASKHGINGFSNSLSKEYLDKNIKVTTICPGGLDTPLWNSSNPYNGDTNRLIKPEEIADLVYFISKSSLQTVYKNVTMFPDNEWH